MTWTEEMRSAWARDCCGDGCPVCDPPRSRGGAVSHDITPKARRVYTCHACGGSIAKGERYRRTEGISGGRAWNRIRCGDVDACDARAVERNARLMADLMDSPLSPAAPREEWPDGIDF